MANFVFKPSAKAFGETVIQRSIDVRLESGVWFVNGYELSQATVDHATAFAIKQRLSNSFVNAATLKDDDGNVLPLKTRLSEWQSMYDKVLAKIIDSEASPSWETVFERIAGESADPFGAQVARLVNAGLRAWAKAKGKKLPKVNSEEWKALAEKYLAKFKVRIESEARRILDEAELAADDFDDLDDSDESEGDDEADDEAEEKEPETK